MSKKFNKIIKNLMMAATASLIGGSASAAVPGSPEAPGPSNHDVSLSSDKRRKAIKDIYKISRGGDSPMLIAGHRSHSSHRSHRSSSNYSAPSYSTPSKKKSGTSRPSSTPRSSSPSVSSMPAPSNGSEVVSVTYHLGDRVIQNVNVDLGVDVTELVELLIKAGYPIDKSTLNTNTRNQTLYVPVIQEAVIDFQRKHNLTADGKVGTSTISALRAAAVK